MKFSFIKNLQFLILAVGIGIFGFFIFQVVEEIDITTIAFKDKIWVIGGMTSNGRRVNDVWCSIELPSEKLEK